MSISLYQIEDALQQLVDLREQAEAEGDSEALKVIDEHLREYLTKEAAKVTSYVALIRSRQATMAAAALEIDRANGILNQARSDVERLKANALAVMQQFGVKELKATPGGGLRIQGNGGRQALDVPEWPRDNSGDFRLLNDEQLQGLGLAGVLPVKKWYTLDTERIREALARGESVPGAKLLERGEHLRVT